MDNENVNGTAQRSFSITDNNLPAASIIYYRIKQCDMNDNCRYTDVKAVRLANQDRITHIYPQLANDKLTIQYHSFNEGLGTITVTDINGKIIMQKNRNLIKGTQAIVINTLQFNSGMYLVTITDKSQQKTSQRFIKE